MTKKTVYLGFILFVWSILILSVPASPYVAVSYLNNGDSVIIEVPVEFTNQTFREWNSIGYFLTHSHYKSYTLNWQGYGGSVSLGKDFIDDIQRAQKQGKIIILNLIGNSYSMHALVACYVNKTVNLNNKYLMFHADAYWASGKDIRTTKDGSRIVKELEHCQQEGIISKRDLDILWTGFEVYVNMYRHWYQIDPRPLSS